MSLSATVAEAITKVNELISTVKGQFGVWDGQVRGKINELEAWKADLIKTKSVNIQSLSCKEKSPTLICDIGNLNLIGSLIIKITWESFVDNRDNCYIWYGGVSGIIYLYNTNNYNYAPPEILALNGTVHHRNIDLPTFAIDSVNHEYGYGDLGLYITSPVECVVKDLTVTFTKIGD